MNTNDVKCLLLFKIKMQNCYLNDDPLISESASDFRRLELYSVDLNLIE
jgi:hypothetical protein